MRSDVTPGLHCLLRYNGKLDAPFLGDHMGVEESESNSTDERAAASRTPPSWTWPDVSEHLAVNTASPLTRMVRATVHRGGRHKVLLAAQIR